MNNPPYDHAHNYGLLPQKSDDVPDVHPFEEDERILLKHLIIETCCLVNRATEAFRKQHPEMRLNLLAWQVQMLAVGADRDCGWTGAMKSLDSVVWRYGTVNTIEEMHDHYGDA